jgi:hypothetical protein
MEVHHHSHTSRKKWTHYFWEFLMLFLAVFCGFLAEYQLEHVIESQREKQYIKSLVKDVEMDVVSLRQTKAVRKKYILWYDSLVISLKQNGENNLNDIYFYARHLGRITEFKYHDGTILQLKNSGGLRLIRNKATADSISIYDNETIKRILSQQEIEWRYRNDILSLHVGKIFNAFIWNEMVDDTAAIKRATGNPPLNTSDPRLLNDFIVQVITLKTAYRLTSGYIEKAIIAAERLITFLKEEYHLK